MLYDRPYMRESYPGRSQIPMYGWIMIITAAVYILQNVLVLFFGVDGLVGTRQTGGGTFLIDWVALTETNISQLKIWTLLTYGLLHGGLFHLIANFLIIFFMGRIVESMIGPQNLLKLYIFSVLGGGIVWTLIHLGGSGGLVIGASAGALGLLIYFCLRNPNEPITLLLFFVLPVTVLPKWVGWGITGITVFGLAFNELGPQTDRIAHSAHLGGIFAGFIFFRYESWFRGISVPRVRLGSASKAKKLEPRYKVNVSKPRKQNSQPSGANGSKNLREEVDRILDKINSSGFGSLTESEKETLNRAKELLGK